MKDRLVYSAYALGWAVLKHLPERAASGLFDGLADFAWRKRGKRVLQLEANLRRVRPGLDEAGLRELSRAGMRSYMRYWMESFRLPVWSRQRVARDVQVEGFEQLREAMESGRGAVIALPHMGNWDLAGAWVALEGYPFTTVAERLKPEKLFDRFVAFRESLGMEVLALTGGGGNVIGTLARRLREGRLVCLVGDRDLSEAGIGVSFFGEATRMPPAGGALPADGGGAAAGVALVRRPGDAGADPPRGARAGAGGPPGEDPADGAGDGGGLGAGDPRAPRGLAHAAAVLAGRPPGPCDGGGTRGRPGRPARRGAGR